MEQMVSNIFLFHCSQLCIFYFAFVVFSPRFDSRSLFGHRHQPLSSMLCALCTITGCLLLLFFSASFFRSFYRVLCGRLLIFCHDFISIFNFLSVGTQNKKITKTKKNTFNQRTFVYTLSSAICCAHGSTLRRISVVNASRRLGTQNVVDRIRKWNNPLSVSSNCRLNIAFLHRRSISECRRRCAIARRSDAKYQTYVLTKSFN